MGWRNTMAEHTDVNRGRGSASPPLAPPAPEISPVRVVVLLVVLVAIAFGVWRLFGRRDVRRKRKVRRCPRLRPLRRRDSDADLPLPAALVQPCLQRLSRVHHQRSLSRARPPGAAYYTLEQAQRSLNLDSRTAQLRREGGTVMVSFGGRDNSELALGCTEVSKLVDAYRAPIKRYHATTIDLDLEGNTLADESANGRRATAIATIQREMAAHTPLRVWLTLPVSSGGLTSEGRRRGPGDARRAREARRRQRDGDGLRARRERPLEHVGRRRARARQHPERRCSHSGGRPGYRAARPPPGATWA